MTFHSITSITAWAKATVQYLGGNPKTPYVLKDNFYHYFSQDEGRNYKLFCTTERDLNHFEYWEKK